MLFLCLLHCIYYLPYADRQECSFMNWYSIPRLLSFSRVILGLNGRFSSYELAVSPLLLLL
jgi:hypothetical protein